MELRPRNLNFIFAAQLLILSSALIPASVECATEEEERETDRKALLQFKSSIRSDPSGLLDLWKDSAEFDHCSWPGISCDAKSRVTGISISGKCIDSAVMTWRPLRRGCLGKVEGLDGVISPAIGGISELRVLRLTFHRFRCDIPGEIWGLKNLELLDFEDSGVSGALTPRFPPKLRVLSLAANEIVGEIPFSLSDCLNLEMLDLSGNKINGTIPGSLGNLINLRELHLSFNRLSGYIPPAIGYVCRNLKVLSLSGNFLVGGIPPNLGNCRELESLLLFSNMLEDVLPREIGQLKKLRVLDISRNSLSGFLPEEIKNCKDLSALILSNPYNPITFKGISNYDEDGEDFNYFQGGITESLTSLPKLRILWAPRSSLQGQIPKNWSSCNCLEVINLGENLLTGEIPSVFEQCMNLRYLNVSFNKLTGLLKEHLPVPCMETFDISGNLLYGSIPEFSCNFTFSTVKFLPYDLTSAYSRYLTSRPLLGRIMLSVLHNFGNNNFTGPLPSLPIMPRRFGNHLNYAFFADRNNLSGSFPGTLFDQCNVLNGLVINISQNMIQGEIPKNISTSCRSLRFLYISRNQIIGDVPQDLGFLPFLFGLDLSRNSLQGEIPPNLNLLKDLEYLLLAGNNLSGEIPVNMGQILSLKVLDLSFNSLSGQIPPDLIKLKNLSVLLLNNNQLSGNFPSDFTSLSSLSVFDVSFNNLSGFIPANASRIICSGTAGNPLLKPCNLRSLFLSTPPPDLQGQRSNPLSPPESQPPRSSIHGFSTIEIASVTSAAAIFSLLLALTILFLYTRRWAPRLGAAVQSSTRREVVVFADIGVQLTYEGVVRSTGNFNASNWIGSGGFGATYKAEIAPGLLIAIKRLSVGRFQGVQQFHAEVKTLGRWRHPNLVTLIGYHVSESEMFLIYNYLPGGNLEKFIQERSIRGVDWRTLHKIALDVAWALTHLHDHCIPRILHRDVKPSNILLDNEVNAYLSDFGLARLLGSSETHATTGVAGTFGYVAPEYALTCRVSDKADVYSYGVVLMELLSDKKVLDPSFSPYGNGFNIVGWAAMLKQEDRASEFFFDGLLQSAPHEDLVEALTLAIMCTADSPSDRPSMKQVVQQLKQLQPAVC